MILGNEISLELLKALGFLKMYILLVFDGVDGSLTFNKVDGGRGE